MMLLLLMFTVSFEYAFRCLSEAVACLCWFSAAHIMLNLIWWSKLNKANISKKNVNKMFRVAWEISHFTDVLFACKYPNFISFTHIIAYAFSTERERKQCHTVAMFCANYTLTFKFHVYSKCFSTVCWCIKSCTIFFSLVFFLYCKRWWMFLFNITEPKNLSNHKTQREEEKNRFFTMCQHKLFPHSYISHLKRPHVSAYAMIHFAEGLPFWWCFLLPVFFYSISKP